MSGLAITITDRGRAALVAARGTNAITIAQIGVTAANFTASPNAQALPGEIKRLTTFSGEASDAYTIHITLRDDSVDAYELRGFALYLSDGTLFGIYGNGPALIMEKAGASMLLLAVDIAFTASDAKQITFGSTNFLNPPATTERQGVVELATDNEATTGTDTTRAVTPKAMLSAVTGWINARFGNGAPSEFIKGLLTSANAAALRTTLAIKSAALKDEGPDNGLNADLLDGKHASAFMAASGIPNNSSPFINARVIQNTNTSAYNDGLYIGYSNTNGGLTRIFGGGASSGGLTVGGSGINDVSVAGYVVLNAANCNQFAPTPTGTGASGTWPIAISGNAASVSNGVYRADFGFYYSGAANQAFGRDTSFPNSRIHPTDNTTADTAFSGSTFNYGTGSAPYTGVIASFGGLGGNEYNLQLQSSYKSSDLAIRTRNGDVKAWNNWQIVLHTGNYNTYSPKLTGEGASGTWAISVSGNAATATTATNATSLTLGNGYFLSDAWQFSCPGFVWKGASSCAFGFSASNGNCDVYTDGNFYATDNKYLVWHAGNDGAGSGLDADTLDGIDSTSILAPRAAFADTAYDMQSWTGYSSVVHTGSSGGVLSINYGGSLGTLQLDFNYNIFASGWRVRNKSDNNSWTPWGWVVMSTENQGDTITGKIWHAGNDGAGSGLDADTLDGIDSPSILAQRAAFADTAYDMQPWTGYSSVAHTGSTGGVLNINYGGSIGTLQLDFNYNVFANGWRVRNKSDNNRWTPWGWVVMSTENQGDTITGNIWHAGNDGAGSGCDADTLDGYHASTFLDGKCAAYILFYVTNGYAYTVASSGAAIQSHQQGGIFYFTVTKACPIGFAIGMAAPIGYSDGINVLPPAQRMSGGGESYHFEFKYTSSKSLTDPGFALIMWF